MPLHQNKSKVTFSVTNCICYDQRVLKIADTVSKLGCEISIIGRRRGECCNNESVPFKTKRFDMLVKKGFLFYAFFNIRLFFYLLSHKTDILVANDLDTLLPNFLVSKIKRIPLIYDSHEYFTGLPELSNRPFVRGFWSFIEKSIFPRLKYVTVVSDPISLLYEKQYGVKPVLIRNAGKKADHILPFSREEINISADDLLVIIQGNGINIDKGAEELIEAVRRTPGVTLMIVGTGDVIPGLKLKVSEAGIEHSVKFFPPVSWETLMRYTKTADVGMCIEKDTNLNYRYSLPNKLFDYIAAGLAIIASDLPETGKLITNNGFGIVIESVTPECISKTLIELKSNPGRITELKRNAIITSSKINWETESKKVIEFYNKVLICE
jgi:glycosyltransferase involved in cell wall biosynthesis